MERRRKKKSHRLYAFFVIIFGILIIALTVILLFHVQRVEVKGNTYCTDKEIIDTVQNDRFSSNSLYVLGKYLLGKGGTLPCLEQIKVGMSAPWVLRIQVEEKTIVGYMYDKNDYVYFDKEGMVVEKGTIPVEGVPCVEGIEVKSKEEYQFLKSKNSGIFEEILKASQELGKYEVTVQKIVCENENIYLYIDNICVSLGNNVTSVKIAQISPIIEKLDGQEGILHLENYSGEQETITFSTGKISEEN